jgi:hypothetical protein
VTGVAGTGAAQELARSARRLATRGRSALATLLEAGDLNMASPAEVRSALGLGTLESTVLSGAFRRASAELGEQIARGVVIGACADVPSGPDPPACVDGAGRSGCGAEDCAGGRGVGSQCG